MANTPTTDTKKKGRESYSHAKAYARKAKRREEAEIRQDKYDSLSLREKLAKANKAPGNSKRELARLNKPRETKATPAVQVPVVPVLSEKRGQKGEKRVSKYRQKTAKN